MRIRISFGSAVKSLLMAGISSGAMMAAVTAADAQTAGYTFTPVKVSGAFLTEANGINDAGQIVGWSQTSQGVVTGFVDTNGTFTTISDGGPTLPYGINTGGNLIGEYEATNPQKSFLDRGGAITFINVPGATAVWTEGQGINDAGEIVGTYEASSGYMHGFTDINGTFATISVAGAAETSVFGVNNAGEIVGFTSNASFTGGEGFLDVNGTITAINDPNAAAVFDYASGTQPYAINNNGVIAGYYKDTSGYMDGFIYANGTYTTIDVPGATNTYVMGINDYVDGPHRSTVTANLFRSPPDICLGFPRFLT